MLAACTAIGPLGRWLVGFFYSPPYSTPIRRLFDSPTAAYPQRSFARQIAKQQVGPKLKKCLPFQADKTPSISGQQLGDETQAVRGAGIQGALAMVSQASPSLVLSDLFPNIQTYLATEDERARAGQGNSALIGPGVKKTRPRNQK